MANAVAAVEFPIEFLAEIDQEVGADQRTSFLTQVAQSELRRRRRMAFLEDTKKNGPAWKEEDHPELADGVYAWVRKIRDEGEKRVKAAEDAWHAE